MNKAIRCVTQKYAIFAGRAGRAEYWGFVLFWFLAVLLAGGLDTALGTYDEGTETGLLGGILGLVLLLPGLAVGSRRLHDTNRSGWWQLVGLIPLIGTLVLLVFYLLPGDEDENRFGAPPA